ncbi:MAG: radical SAM protein [Defluviitaleaceae bacterium]|nr:radical SAM protein [Defluviitaleaceae bacterium]
MKPLKYLNFTKCYNISYFSPTALFVRIIPTDNCNLNCAYCFQKKDNAASMTWEMFVKILDKAIELRVGLISFLGGEPMIWEHIYDAIALCTKHNILTDMTTNGTLLDDVTIQKLGNAGLDYLNVSVDTQSSSIVSKKNVIFDKSVLASLKAAEKDLDVKLRVNSVIYNNNFDDIKLLLDVAHEVKIPLSLGFIVPDLGDTHSKEIYFTEEDTGLLNEIVLYILQKKKEGYSVIDPDAYFTNVFKFLKRENFWECNYPTKYGWLNVTSDGAVRGCTKKMDDTGFDFLSLTTEKIVALKKSLEAPVKACNPYCYSNCAYDSSYYKSNKAAFIVDNFKKLF